MTLDIPVPLQVVFAFLLVFSVIMCAFFSSTETAFATLNKFKFKVEAEEGSKTAARILKLHDKFDNTLISVLIGNNAFAITISTVSTLLFMQWFSAFLPDSVVSLIASILMAIVTFLFGDTIPKYIAKKIPDTVARRNVYPMYFFYYLFFPLMIVFRGISNLAKKIVKTKEEPEITEDDFADAVEAVEEIGELEENESEIIQASLEFDDTTVREVLTPLKKMTMLDTSGLTKEKLLEFLKDCSYSRIPLYFKTKNQVVGVLVVKNYLNAYFADPSTNYLDWVQKPYFVSPSVKIDDLLDGYKEHHTQIAIVRKNRQVLGMVTMEDVLEELVGKISEAKEEI